MKKILKELQKNFLEKEVTMLEVVGECQRLAFNNKYRFNDIFESENWESVKDGNFVFVEKFDEYGMWDSGIEFEFTVVKENKNKWEVVIKIDDITLV